MRLDRQVNSPVLQFLIDLHQVGTDLAQAGGFVGKNAHHLSTAPDLAAHPIQTVVGPTWLHDRLRHRFG